MGLRVVDEVAREVGARRPLDEEAARQPEADEQRLLASLDLVRLFRLPLTFVSLSLCELWR